MTTQVEIAETLALTVARAAVVYVLTRLLVIGTVGLLAVTILLHKFYN